MPASAGDDNGDGVADLYIIAGDKTLSVRSGARNGLFGAARQLTGGWNFTQTTAGDFTGDRLASPTARDPVPPTAPRYSSGSTATP